MFSSVPVQAALDIFLHDVPEPAARLAAGRRGACAEDGTSKQYKVGGAVPAPPKPPVIMMDGPGS